MQMILLFLAHVQQLLTVCTVCGVEQNIKYNTSNSDILICGTKEDKSVKFTDFKLSDNYLGVCDKVYILIGVAPMFG